MLLAPRSASQPPHRAARPRSARASTGLGPCRGRLAICLLMLMASGPAPAQQERPTASPPPVHPLSSMTLGHDRAQWRFLDSLVGDTHLVLLGESGHGVQQPLEIRNRMFEYLVEEHGFTALAAETGFEEGVMVNDYISGRRALSPAIVRAVFSFASPCELEANRLLLEWMRRHNERVAPERAVRFYGIEMLGNASYTTGTDRRPVRRSVDAALDYLSQVDPASGKAWRLRLQPLLAELVAQDYFSIPAEHRDNLTSSLADLSALFGQHEATWSRLGPAGSYRRGYRSLRNAINLDADLRAGGWWARGTPATLRRDVNRRDASMAENVHWVMEQEGESGKVMLFSAFTHAARGGPMKHRASADGFHSMGSHLHSAFNRGMVVIGMVDGHAAPSGHQDNASGLPWRLTQADVFAVDFSQIPARDRSAQGWDRLCALGNCRLPLLGSADAVVFIRDPAPALITQGTCH